jgi:hypothetical protein
MGEGGGGAFEFSTPVKVVSLFSQEIGPLRVQTLFNRFVWLRKSFRTIPEETSSIKA